MRTSERAIAAIKNFEGFRAVAYLDAACKLTIGYGETLHVEPGQRVTEAQADMMLRANVAEIEHQLSMLVKTPLSQGMFDALVDFAYNEGIHALAESTLLKELNAGNLNAAAQEFLRWDEVNGHPNAWQEKRRATEKAWFEELPNAA